MNAHSSSQILSASELLERARTAGVPSTDLPTSVAVDRYIGISGTHNFRELGGIAVADGSVVKSGVLFRSDHLNEVTDLGLTELEALNLHRVYDFRLPLEQTKQPSRLPAGVPVTHLATGDLSAAEAMVTLIPKMLSGAEPIAPATWWDDNYVDMLSRAKDMFVTLSKGLASPDGVPAMFHCTGGKDRTGMASMVLLQTLGASDEDIVDDFLATNVFRTPVRLPHWQPQFESAGITQAQAMPILGVTRSGIESALRELKRLGGAEQYLRDGGMSNAELAQLRANLTS
jgi:protein-tyrosine phosphatase